MTATYSTYPAAAWQDPSTSADPFGTAGRNEENSFREQRSSHRDTSAVHHKQLPPEVQGMKNRRKRRTVASGVAGGVLGLVVAGPVLGIAAGIGGAYAAKRVGKRNEKRRMEKLEAEKNPLRSNGSGEML